MHTHKDTTAQDLRRVSLIWLERFFILLFITLAVWYLFRWWAILPGVIAAAILVRSITRTAWPVSSIRNE